MPRISISADLILRRSPHRVACSRFHDQTRIPEWPVSLGLGQDRRVVVAAKNNSSGVARDQGTAWNILNHSRPRSDGRAIADCNWAQNSGMGTDPNSIADLGSWVV